MSYSISNYFHVVLNSKASNSLNKEILLFSVCTNTFLTCEVMYLVELSITPCCPSTPCGSHQFVDSAARGETSVLDVRLVRNCWLRDIDNWLETGESIVELESSYKTCTASPLTLIKHWHCRQKILVSVADNQIKRETI